jgi:2-keto-4-pentenoate hydratase/2-oxohepta-3-ene-1,7-dioic acid hydratase in catechol pathway
VRLATFTLKAGPRQPRVGALLDGKVVELAARSMKELLALGKPGLDAAKSPRASHPLADVAFLPPIPDADKFLCVGKNYRTHLEELQRCERPRAPRSRTEGPFRPQMGK